MRVKKLILILFLVLFMNQFASAQAIVEKGKFPYKQLVEWPNHGMLILGEDPSNHSTDRTVSLLDNKGETAWTKNLQLGVDNPHLIVSEQSNYIYFIDNLEPENKTIGYNQMNKSGSIVSTKLNVFYAIREFGYRTPSNLILKDIVNTRKSLVFYFQLPVKNEGIIENIFISITHHNNRVYYFQGPPTHLSKLKDEEEGPYLFAGADENTICFARYKLVAGNKRINFLPFSPKGKAQNSYHFSLPKTTPIRSELIPKTLSGAYYVAKEDDFTEVNGKGVYWNKRYYYVLNDASDRCFKLFGANKEGEIVALNKCVHPAASSRRYDASIFYSEVDDKLLFKSKIEDKSSYFTIGETDVNQVELKNIDLNHIQQNPSSFGKDISSTFVHLIDGVPYYIDFKEQSHPEKLTFKKH